MGNVCSAVEVERRKLCLDCIVPTPCTLNREVSVTPGVAMDITIVYVGGTVKLMLGESSVNTVTEIGSNLTVLTLGDLVGTGTTVTGFGADSSVVVCSDAQGQAFMGTIKS